MATNQTTNYQLNQWEPTDQVLRTDFNADNAKLDAALADLAEDVAGKAEQTDLCRPLLVGKQTRAPYRT